VRLTTRNVWLLGAAGFTLLSGVAASAQSTAPDALTSLASPVADDIAASYATYHLQPIWTRAGINEAAVAQLVAILQKAPFDGFAEGPQLAAQVQAAAAQARSGDPGALTAAERVFSTAWVRYVQTIKRPTTGMIYAYRVGEIRKGRALARSC